MASYAVKNGKHSVRYSVYVDGKRVQKRETFATQAEARHRIIDIEAGLADTSPVADTSGVRFGPWARRHLERYARRKELAPSTIDQQTILLDSLILPTFEDLDLTGITSRQIEDWVFRLLDTHSRSTVRQAILILRRTLESAVTQEPPILNRNPCHSEINVSQSRSVSGNARKIIVGPVQVEDIASRMPDRYANLVRVLAYTGRRWGEVAGAQTRYVTVDTPSGSLPLDEAVETYGVEGLAGCWGTMDYTAHDCVLKERHGRAHDHGLPLLGRPKTRHSERVFPIDPFLVSLLVDQWSRFPGRHGMVFTTREGKAISRSAFRRPFKRAIGQKFAGMTPHHLRASFKNLIREAEIEWETAQELIGHSKGNSVTARHYASNNNELLRRAVGQVADYRDKVRATPSREMAI